MITSKPFASPKTGLSFTSRPPFRGSKMPTVTSSERRTLWDQGAIAMPVRIDALFTQTRYNYDKKILLLAAAIGFIAESSVFAADPSPAPSPTKGAVTKESASPTASPAEKKTRRRTRVEARRTGRDERRKARKEPKASPTPQKASATPTPKQ
jgi:hypothetical protein